MIAELATLLEVTATNLYFWKRRLPERSTDVRTADPRTTRAGLVEVRAATRTLSSAGLPSPGALELRLADGRSILVPSGFEPDDLRALVGALEPC
jgi:transposase-like protein